MEGARPGGQESGRANHPSIKATMHARLRVSNAPLGNRNSRASEGIPSQKPTSRPEQSYSLPSFPSTSSRKQNIYFPNFDEDSRNILSEERINPVCQQGLRRGLSLNDITLMERGGERYAILFVLVKE